MATELLSEIIETVSEILLESIVQAVLDALSGEKSSASVTVSPTPDGSVRTSLSVSPASSCSRQARPTKTSGRKS